MLSFLAQSVLLVRLGSVQSPLSSRIVLPFCRTLSSNAENNDWCTVSYLVQSCGLSRDSALIASKDLNLESPDNPDRVLAFLRAHSFSDIHIARAVRYCPNVLSCNPKNTLLPKFEFFYSKGFSKLEVACILASNPKLLNRSLKNCIIPLFEFYKSLFNYDDEVVSAIKPCRNLLGGNFVTKAEPIINILKDFGIPMSNIVWLFRWHPGSFLKKNDGLINTLKKVQYLGFDRESKLFVIAFSVITGMTEASWDKKVSVYKRWGWSEETVIKAFLKQPFCMSKSEEKIAAVMDYFVNKLGCESLMLAQSPYIIGYSMERRIIPRTSVIQTLQNKGLVSKNLRWSSILVVSEKHFVQKYIYPYEEEASELMTLYETSRQAPYTPERDIYGMVAGLKHLQHNTYMNSLSVAI